MRTVAVVPNQTQADEMNGNGQGDENMAPVSFIMSTQTDWFI